jgi:F-type H+-transporting ATPase subunit b
MRGVKQFVGILSLASLALWFALSFGTAFASGQASQPAADSHAVSAPADGHGNTAAKSGGSLSIEKVKDLGWRVVNFIALMIILVKFGAKPIGSGLAARRKQIKDDIENLQQKRVESEESYRTFQEKLANVESEIDTIVEKAIAQAEIEKTKIIEKAEQAADDIKRTAEMAIQNEITEARRSLKNEVAEQAAVMAEELIVKNLTNDDQFRIIDDYLAKVGAVN